MEQHAKDDSDKAIFLLINIEGPAEAATGFKAKHNLQHVEHGSAQPPPEYGLKYIPHHFIIGNDGKIIMNFDTPSRDYMSLV